MLEREGESEGGNERDNKNTDERKIKRRRSVVEEERKDE